MSEEHPIMRGRGMRPTVTVPLDEFSLLNQRVGFLEGVIYGLHLVPDSDRAEVLDNALKKYKDICEK